MTFNTGSHTGRTAASTVTRTRYSTTRSGVVVDAVVWTTRARRGITTALRRGWQAVVSTVTPAGWLVIAALTAGTVLGLVYSWIELVVAGVAALVLLVLALPFLFGVGAYRVDLGLTRERVVAGTEVAGTVRVVNAGRRIALPGRLDIPVGEGLIDVEVPLLRPGGDMDQELIVPAHRRGIIPVGPVTSVRTDPLGLLRRARTWTERSELFVHPRTVSVPSTSAGIIRDLEGTPSRDIVDSDISFHAIREYMPGDSPRHIHWKSTAKAQTLMVRQYEETRRSRLAMVLSRRRDEYATEDEFEMAVSVIGSLGVRAIRDGREITVVTGADVPEAVADAIAATTTLRTLTTRSLLDALSGVEQDLSTPRLESICTLTGQEVPGLSLAILVVGSTIGIRRLQAASLAFPASVGVLVIRCDPESEPSVRTLGSLTVLSIGVLDDVRHLLARGALT